MLTITDNVEWIAGSRNVPLTEGHRFSTFEDHPCKLTTWRNHFNHKHIKNTVGLCRKGYALYVEQVQVGE